MIKSPMEVVATCDKLIGNPVDLQKLMENKDGKEFDQEFEIPGPEQKAADSKPVEK